MDEDLFSLGYSSNVGTVIFFGGKILEAEATGKATLVESDWGIASG